MQDPSIMLGGSSILIFATSLMAIVEGLKKRIKERWPKAPPETFVILSIALGNAGALFFYSQGLLTDTYVAGL